MKKLNNDKSFVYAIDEHRIYKIDSVNEEHIHGSHDAGFGRSFWLKNDNHYVVIDKELADKLSNKREIERIKFLFNEIERLKNQ